MKKNLIMAALGLCLLASLSACGPDASVDPDQVALKVNEVTISVEEFNELIKLQAYADPEMNLTNESRKEYIDYLIRKELLIQEAIRLKMDRKKEFIKTIETYWESTLVQRLLEQKTKELQARVLITEEDMTSYYEENRDEFDQPYEEVKTSIRSILVSEKINSSLEEWAKSLRASADITVSPSLTTGSK